MARENDSVGVSGRAVGWAKHGEAQHSAGWIEPLGFLCQPNLRDMVREINVFGVRSSPQPCMMKLNEMLSKGSKVKIRDLLGRPSQPEGWF